MTNFPNQSIRKISTHQLFSNYPFTIQFATELLFNADAVMCSSCVEELIPTIMGEDIEDFKQNLGNSFLVFYSSYAKKFGNTLFYIKFDENQNKIYIDISELLYEDNCVSYFLFLQKKNGNI